MVVTVLRTSLQDEIDADVVLLAIAIGTKARAFDEKRDVAFLRWIHQFRHYDLLKVIDQVVALAE